MLKTTGARNCSATGTLDSLGTRALTRPSPAPKQPQQLPCNRSSGNREQPFNDLIYQELAGRGTGADRAPDSIHRSQSKPPRHPEGSARRLKTDMSRPIRTDARVSEAPAKCHVGLTRLKPLSPTALTQLSLSSDNPMCSTRDIFKNQQKRLKHVLPGPIYSSQACEFTRYSSSSSIKNRLS